MSACSSGSSWWRRSDRRRSAVWILGAGLFLVSSLTARSTEGDGTRHGTGVSLMNDLSQRFQRLEAHVAAADSAGVLEIASDLSGFRQHLAATRPHVNLGLTDVFDQHVTRFGELVGELSALASEGRAAGVEQAFEELRATCVSCHVRFRSDNARRGDYPARENTLTGTVTLFDADGELRENRSWVLVFLEGERPVPVANARRNPRISQSERRFEPRVLPVVVGTQVDFPNDDTIFHNVFSLSKTAPFDLGVYEPGESASVRMQRTGLVKVYCNIHPEMAASIVVLSNPWYSLTDRAGQFVLCGVPDGEYVLRAWNDMGAESRETLRVEGGLVFDRSIELRETRRAVTHTNKYGKPYPGKYK
jgi:plastocyanin